MFLSVSLSFIFFSFSGGAGLGGVSQKRLILSYESKVIDTSVKDISFPIAANSNSEYELQHSFLEAEWVTDISLTSSSSIETDLNMASGNTDHRTSTRFLVIAKISDMTRPQAVPRIPDINMVSSSSVDRGSWEVF